MTNETELDDKRHLYLYAKGHYHRDNIHSDLRKIVARIIFCDPEHVEMENILYWLTTMAYSQMEKESRPTVDCFREFLADIHPNNCWKVGYRHSAEELGFALRCVLSPSPGHPEVEYNMETAIIYKCLSILRLASLDKIPFELGTADETLLPLPPKYSQHSTEFA